MTAFWRLTQSRQKKPAAKSLGNSGPRTRGQRRPQSLLLPDWSSRRQPRSWRPRAKKALHTCKDIVAPMSFASQCTHTLRWRPDGPLFGRPPYTGGAQRAALRSVAEHWTARGSDHDDENSGLGLPRGEYRGGSHRSGHDHRPLARRSRVCARNHWGGGALANRKPEAFRPHVFRVALDTAFAARAALPEEPPAISCSSPGGRILEIGPGDGAHALPVARSLIQNGFPDAVDIQQQMLDILARRTQTARLCNVREVLADARNLPCADNSFDGAFPTVGRAAGRCAQAQACTAMPPGVSRNWIRGGRRRYTRHLIFVARGMSQPAGERKRRTRGRQAARAESVGS